MPEDDRHRASYSDVELHRMLAIERLVLAQQLWHLKRDISERVGQIERIERRLADIELADIEISVGSDAPALTARGAGAGAAEKGGGPQPDHTGPAAFVALR